MSKIKNISGEDRIALLEGNGSGRLVIKGQAIDVPDERVTAYTQLEELWEPHDAQAKELHKAMLSDLRAWIDALEGVEEEAGDDTPVEPAGSASRDDWARYVVDAGLATEDQLVDDAGKPLTRDQIRDTYKKQES